VTLVITPDYCEYEIVLGRGDLLNVFPRLLPCVGMQVVRIARTDRFVV
jgi:hypothetical protein